MALIEGTQGQKSGIASDLPAGKIDQDRLMTVEGESSVVIKHFVSSDGCSERECWVHEPSVHLPFRASFLSWRAKSANNPG
jgi:hypothetical protein